MTNKPAGAKMKSKLAMASVIAVTAATIGLTTVGIYSYARAGDAQAASSPGAFTATPMSAPMVELPQIAGAPKGGEREHEARHEEAEHNSEHETAEHGSEHGSEHGEHEDRD